MKMGKEILTFGDIEIKKKIFHWPKSLIFLNDADIERELISKKISSGEKKYLLVTYIMIIKLSHYT